jgi:hypothetical protein
MQRQQGERREQQRTTQRLTFDRLMSRSSHRVAAEDESDAVKRHRSVQHLEANIHKTVVAIAEHELEHSGALPLTRGAVASITELSSLVFSTLIDDSMAFARHASRRNVGERDVLLCARRTKQNHAQLLAFLEGLTPDDLSLPPNVASSTGSSNKRSKPAAKKKRPAVVLDSDADVDDKADAVGDGGGDDNDADADDAPVADRGPLNDDNDDDF